MSGVRRIDLNDPEIVADPFPTYERLRAEGPIVWNELLDTWLVTSVKTFRRIVTDTERFTSAGTIEAENFGDEAYIVIDDKERHDALRGVWAREFRRGALAEGLTPLIEDVVDQLLAPLVERMRDGETVDVDAGLCRDLPTYVICAMLGVPLEDRAKFAAWSDAMGAIPFVEPEELETHPAFIAAQQGAKDMGDYLYGELERRRRDPGDDLISKLVHSDVAATMSEESMMQNCRQLLFAGNETTAKWLNNLLVTFAKFPEARAEIEADRELLPAAMEEELRWEGLVNLTPRKVRGGAVEVDGEELEDGASVWLLNSAVNRDPEWHLRPEVFDIHRPAGAHMGFGFGMHSCLGVNLGRLEARTAMNRILDEIPGWEIAGPLEYGSYFPLRAPHPLHIALA